MLRLITILESLRRQPRRLTDEENLYLHHLGDELQRAPSDAARWRILEREGMGRSDGFDLGSDVLERLAQLRRAAMN